jgi:serine/threonine protein kinase
MPAEAQNVFGSRGTAPYTAPEQAEGEPGDFRSDLYALGQMIAEIWGGKVPARQTLGRLWQREAPDGMPRAVEEMVREMLALDPVQRTADLSHVAETLRHESRKTA